nr:hypothetical protein [uncultured Gellertiella sp.]
MQHLVEKRGAEGRLPIAVRARGTVTRTVIARPETVEGFDAVDIYRRHRGLDDRASTVAFVRPQDGPHDRRLTSRIAALFETVDPSRSCIIYVHRGYQPNYRTPMLQSLLAALPRLGGVSSLRARTPDLPPETEAVMLSQLSCFDHVLVVNDQHERLSCGLESSREATVEYALIDRLQPAFGKTCPPAIHLAKSGLATNPSGAS